MERDRRYGWGEDRDRWGRDERHGERSYGYGREQDEDHRQRGGYFGGRSRDEDWRERDERSYGGAYGRERDDDRERGGMRGMIERGMERGREMGREWTGRDRDTEEGGGGYGRLGLGELGGWGSSHGMRGYGGTSGWGSERDREGYGGGYYGSGSHGSSGYGMGGYGMGGHGPPGGYGSSRGYGTSGMGGYGASSGYGGSYGHGAMGGHGGYGRSEGRDWSRERSSERGFADRDRDRDREEGGLFQRMGEGIKNVFGMGERERGPFFGRGPKGYKRSDERIREEVSEVIARQGWIDASDVEVKVQNGDVTLTGTVQDREHKRRLEMMIEDIPGVDDVRNELRIKRGEQATTGASTYGSTETTETSQRGRNARTS